MKTICNLFVWLSLAIIVGGCASAVHSQDPAWQALSSQRQQLLDQAKYQDALKVAESELAAAQQSLTPASSQLAGPLEDLAVIETAVGNYADAQTHWQSALDLQQKQSGTDSVEAAQALDGLARNEDQWCHFDDARAHFQAALGIQEKRLGADDPAIAASLLGLGHLKTENSEYDEAASLLKRALAIREKSPGRGQLDLARTLNAIAYLDLSNGDDDGAHQSVNRVLAMLDKPGEPLRPELATALDYLGNVNLNASRFTEAEPLFQRTFSILVATLGHDNQDVANALNDLARVNDDNGNYKEAESYYKQSIAVYAQALGGDNINVAAEKDSLAGMYDTLGKYPQAEPLFQDAIAIDSKGGPISQMNLAYDLNNYAQHKLHLGKYADAEPLMQQTLAIFQKLLPPDNPSIATALNNLEELYSEENKYAEAEPIAKRALAMEEKAYGPNNPSTAVAVNNLAEIYEGERRYPEAEALYVRSLDIDTKGLRPGHPDIARQMHNLANLYGIEGKFREADALFPKAVAMRAESYGEDDEDVLHMTLNYADEQYAEGQRQQADSLFDRYFAGMHGLFDRQFIYMGENDRLDFIGRFKDSFPIYFSFCLNNHQQDNALAGKMYDVLLWRKGMVGNSIAALRAKIAASGDSQALALLDQLRDMKTRLATLLSSPPEDRTAWQQQVQKLQHDADDLEKQLARRSSSLAEQKQLEDVTWQQVRDALKPGEAAVEMVRFVSTDGRKNNGPTYYVALVIRSDTRNAPQFIVVGKGDTLESDAIADYGSRIRQFQAASHTPSGKTFYAAFWEPLLPALKGVKRIYLSPDGILNQASLGIVADTHGRLLMEKYDLRIVPSTRDLHRVPATAATDSAVLVGGPDFALAPMQYLAAVEASRRNNTATAPELRVAVADNRAPSHLSRDFQPSQKCPLPGSGILCPLPGAMAEVDAVGTLLQSHDWQTSLYQGDTALEETIKAVHRPRVLHIATHGFFLPDQGAGAFEDPMLRSGLYFAGADNTLAGNPPPENADDGVLTAFEAAQLDLQGTELVVLSACDTGLGASQSGEGVFGLNRALQEAGAQSVMMSMWSVPDRETQELMKLFYANWLTGMDKHAALRRAELAEQEVVRQRYGADLPYYWGAFVMVGR